jgi:hypothetical protein
MIENITTAQPYLTVFPDANDVFAEPVAQYAKHIIPLISIDLAAVNPAWHGKIHVVCPVEPCEGYLGEYTQAFHNDYLKTNWIGFRLNTENKYELLGDFKFFLLENTDAEVPYPHIRDELAIHYRVMQESCNLAKQCFKQYDGLFQVFRFNSKYKTLNLSIETPRKEPLYLIHQLGGNAPDGNWVENNEGVTVMGKDTDDIYPVTPDGKRFYFVAYVDTSCYLHPGGGWILLFFEPETSTVLLTFDYS